VNMLIDQLDFIKLIIKGIATHFGDKCEVVLHDYNQPAESTIVAIENGHITNRRIGDCVTNFSLEMLRGANNQENKYNYLNQTKGRILRSSSIYIRDDLGQIIGSICINSDITDLVMAEKSIQKQINIDNEQKAKEVFTNDVNELLDVLIQESIDYVGVPIALMDKDQKIKGLKYLDKKGAFLIKKAGDKIAKMYDISKYTIYNYLED
jgi:predicted transcriptional regulator YheO